VLDIELRDFVAGQKGVAGGGIGASPLSPEGGLSRLVDRRFELDRCSKTTLDHQKR
jgi:hypothetical protein